MTIDSTNVKAEVRKISLRGKPATPQEVGLPMQPVYGIDWTNAYNQEQ